MNEQTIRAIELLEEEKMEAVSDYNYKRADKISLQIEKLIKESEEENGSK